MYINPRIVMLQCDFPPNVMGDQIYKAEDYSDLLPKEAKATKFKLYGVTFGSDPLILYDQKGHILKIWDSYMPSMAEIEITCSSFL